MIKVFYRKPQEITYTLLIRFEPSFIELTEKLEGGFSEQSKTELAEKIESKYDKLKSIILELEKSKDKLKPKVSELGKVGSRAFAFSIYYDDDLDDVPIRIRELIPTISPVRLDLMATIETLRTGSDSRQLSPTDQASNYLRVAYVYDDGSARTKYLSEVLRNDEV